MEVLYTKKFDRQRVEFAFKFTCEHCAHFDEKSSSCLHEFPNEEHRLDYYTASERPHSILFCKDFDLA